MIHLEIRFDKKVTMDPGLILKKLKTLRKIEVLNKLKTLLKHPSPTNIETVMKVLGIAIKIGQFQNLKEKGTLSSFWSLVNYHKTPHSAIDVSLTK